MADLLTARFRVLRGLTVGEPAPALPAWLTAAPPRAALPARAYALARRQFAAEALLAELPAAPAGEALIGFTTVDLFLGGRPFVFGASVPAHGVALVSTARLAGAAARLDKVARHELGHLAGLDDCDGACLMTPASAVADIDVRPHELCARCAAHLAALTLA